MNVRVLKTIAQVLAGLLIVVAVMVCCMWLNHVTDRQIAERNLEARKADPLYLGDVAGFRVDEFVHPKTGERFLIVSSHRGVSVTQIRTTE